MVVVVVERANRDKCVIKKQGEQVLPGMHATATAGTWSTAVSDMISGPFLFQSKKIKRANKNAAGLRRKPVKTAGRTPSHGLELAGWNSATASRARRVEGARQPLQKRPLWWRQNHLWLAARTSLDRTGFPGEIPRDNSERVLNPEWEKKTEPGRLCKGRLHKSAAQCFAVSFSSADFCSFSQRKPFPSHNKHTESPVDKMRSKKTLVNGCGPGRHNARTQLLQTVVSVCGSPLSLSGLHWHTLSTRGQPKTATPAAPDIHLLLRLHWHHIFLHLL